MKNISLAFLFMLCSIYTNAQISPPYSQNFETSAFPPSGWQTFPLGSSINWQYDTTASGYGIGSACISFDNFNTTAGSYYGIRLPAMSFDSVLNPYIRFDIAYAQKTGTGSDIFGIWWSNNGSSNWQNVINYSAGSLATASSTTSLFVPSVGEWQTKTLSLSSLAGLPYVRLAIEDDCNNGNKIYFDNVLVFDSSTNVNVNEISNANQLLLFPNPAGHEINVLNNSTLPIQLSLYNCLGERILEKVLFDKLNTINISDYSEGSYFYTLSSETKVIKKGVVFKQ